MDSSKARRENIAETVSEHSLKYFKMDGSCSQALLYTKSIGIELAGLQRAVGYSTANPTAGCSKRRATEESKDMRFQHPCCQQGILLIFAEECLAAAQCPLDQFLR